MQSGNLQGDWCENRGMEFKILTEKHLNPQYKYYV